ncbi:hypothetical protein Tco_0703654 [Tanacetum coccineum]|uniref:Uncharacterized protein n=1 Tax=Tanacetum coccineum TaxID=301880 RepID=A0ABQ4XZE4_9ASTR
METIHVDFDKLIAMASGQSSLGPTLHEMTPGTISSGLVQNLPSSTPYVPPTKNDWDLLFQPMFDEYFNPPPSVVSPVHVDAAPRHANPTGLPLSTSIDQAAPSASTLIIKKTQNHLEVLCRPGVPFCHPALPSSTTLPPGRTSLPGGKENSELPWFDPEPRS